MSSGTFSAITDYCSITNGAWRRTGNVVNFRANGGINFSAIGTENVFTTIMEGLPNAEIQQGAILQVMSSTTPVGDVICMINTNGTITINNNASKLTTTSGYSYISGTYIAS